MVPRKDFFNDEETPSERPGKARNFGKNPKDKRRFETQEDFGITRRSKGRSDDMDDELYGEFEEDEELLDDDEFDEDFDEELDFEEDDDDFEDDDDL